MIVAKIFLLAYLWVMIVIGFVFLIKCRSIYSALHVYEKLCLKGKRELLREILPVVESLSIYNKKIASFLNLRWTSFVEISFSLLALIKAFISFKNLKQRLRTSIRNS